MLVYPLKLSSAQILELGKDFFLSRIDELSKGYAKQGKGNFHGYELSSFLKIYEVFELYYEYYLALCRMVEDKFPLYEYRVKVIIGKVCDTSKLKELLLNYYYVNNDEMSDEYKKCADLLEGN